MRSVAGMIKRVVEANRINTRLINAHRIAWSGQLDQSDRISHLSAVTRPERATVPR
jgi:hypothetical protein